MVLLHGLGGAASNWRCRRAGARRARPRRRAGASRPRRLLGASRAGGRRSTRMPTASPAVLDAPAVVAGHSLGGLVALRLALRHPQLVRGVVLAGSAGISTGTRRSQRALAVASADPARQAHRAASPPGQRSARLCAQIAFGFVNVADPRAFEPRVAEAFIAGAALHTGVREAADALVRTDPRRDLERVRVAALVLHGARDRHGAASRRVRIRATARRAAARDRGLRSPADRRAAARRRRRDRRHFLDRVVDVEELPVEGELVG